MPKQNWQYWQAKTALVTGASSGIGLAIARSLAARGLRLVLSARRVDRLETLAAEIRAAGGQALVLPADLSQLQEVYRLAEAVLALPGGVDVLINNAGLGWYGYYVKMPQPVLNELIQVNIVAPAVLTRLLLPAMLDRACGRIINISSISGAIPSQGIVLYGASKAFLDSFSTSLHRELRGSGVAVCAVRPGPVTSEFYARAANREGGRPVPAERFAVSAGRVAAVATRLLPHPRRVVNIPSVLALVPWVELCFGWLIDPLGPLLLRRPQTPSPPKD